MLITKYGNSLVHCSGSLVTPQFGLSAGHCFTGNSPDYVPTDEMSLFFGVGDIKQLTGKIPFRAFKIQKRDIKKILIHTGYEYPRVYTVAINELLCMKNAGAEIAMDFS